MTPHDTLAALWSSVGGDPAALATLQFSHAAYQLPSTFHVGAIAGASIGAQALAAADIWRNRTGRVQHIGIDMRHAAALFRSERYLTVNGGSAGEPSSPITGFYQAGDGRWLQLHTNFPHHLAGVLRVLGCENSHAAVAAAIGRWHAAELDQRLADEGLCASLIRTPQEWAAHPQAAAIAALPLLEIEHIGDAPPQPVGDAQAARPLSGVRVLDLSRVIAAPVAGRTLAQHGAEVLAVSAAHLPNIMPLVIDTGRGKRATQLDLRTEHGRDTLHALVRGADVFLQAYRPGALAAHGLTTDDLMALRPGLVQVSLSAYGHTGPWAERRGYDSLVQSATGIADECGRAAGLAAPGKLPCQALDHATGYLAPFGAMVALQRRSVEGGSWQVRVSLAQTGRWLQSLGRAADGLAQPDLEAGDVAGYLQVMASPFGSVSAIAPAEQMSDTPPHFALPPAPLDADAPRWSR